jgi:signal transduction histidine kinase/CheY-like chemotaxis protein
VTDFQRILDDLPVGIWVGRVPDGQAEYANHAFAEILGVPVSEKSVIEDVPATYSVRDRAGRPFPVERLPFSQVVATKRPAIVDEIVIHRPDGRKVNVRAFGSPVTDAKGALVRVIVAFLDITQEVVFETERNTVESRLALAVNHAPIVIWTADREGVVTLSEGAGLKALGVVSGQLVGQNLFQLYKDHPTIPGDLKRALAGAAFSYTTEVGKAIYDTWLTPLHDAHGAVTGIAGLSNDVSEIRTLQGKALQNDRVNALGTLAASVAHEINNPLTYVLGHIAQAGQALEALEREPGSTEALELLRGHLDTIRRGAERMAVVTGELRSFSRSDDRALDRVQVAAAVRSVLKLVGKNLDAQARATIDLQETPPVVANESRLVQAILNLVVNALQAVEENPPPERRIDIRTFTDAGAAVVEVSDNGPGVDPSDRDRIFDAFYSTKGIGKGTGLGLFVSRNIVRAAGGDIHVSARPGGGARFQVRLPLSAVAGPAAARAADVVERPPASAAGRVLIIDDDPLVAEALVLLLRQEGYEAESINDSVAALESLAASCSFDLVYCDLMMGRLTGMELAAQLERRAPATADRLVFMTGGAFTPESQAFLEAHEGRSVEKPFDILVETSRRLGRPAHSMSESSSHIPPPNL